MAGLDTRFVLAFTFEQYFVDKDTGLALVDGYINFFEDNARTVPKDVYILSGTEPNYTYTNIGATVTLGADGCPNYLGNNVALYFLPQVSLSDSTLQLYFYQVYSSGDVFQFSREAQPNLATGSGGSEPLDNNYIANSQFLLHLNIPETDTTAAGQITLDSTPIAYGGWSYEKSTGFTSKDFITFTRFNSIIDPDTNPPNSPRYSVDVKCEMPAAGEAIKYLQVRFDDVDKFSTNLNEFTFTFQGQSNSGSNLTVELLKISYFGAGSPSMPVPVTLGTFTITPAYSQFTVSFTPGDNVGETLSANNDDYVAFSLSFPVNALFDASFTDFGLFEGAIGDPVFAPATNTQMVAGSIIDLVPDYNGFSIYLPMMIGPSGLQYDDSVVGMIYASMSILTPPPYLLPCFAQTLETNGYTNFIPNARLQSRLFNNTTGFPIFGTGSQFVTTNVFTGVTNAFRLWTNSPGTVTAPAEGAVPTGFTFGFGGANPLIRVSTTGFTVFSYYINSIAYIQCLVAGDVATPVSHATGVSVALIRGDTSSVEVKDNKALFYFQVNANTITASEYIDFEVGNGGSATQYFIWFTVNGAGTVPGGTGTPIQVNILSTYTAVEVAQILVEALNGFQISQIVTVAGSVVPPNSYWTFHSITSQQYVVWYNQTGEGTQPTVAGAIYIPVVYQMTDTAAMIADQTKLAINKAYFALPDLRGAFLRGFDNGAGVDPDSAVRYSLNGITYGDQIGTYQIDEIINHFHKYGTFTTISKVLNDVGLDVPLTAVTDPTTSTGGNESRPINVYTNYLIHL